MPAGLNYVRADVTQTLTAQGTGTVTGSISAQPNEASFVRATLVVSAVTGTPSAALTIEQSANGTSGWATIPGGTTTAVTAAGSAIAAAIPTQPYIRTSVAVSGTTPSVTGVVVAEVFTD